METHDAIRRIIEYMNIPDLEMIFKAKLIEVEKTFKPKIRELTEMKARYRKMSANEMTMIENEPFNQGAGSLSYYFELKRIDSDPAHMGYRWRICEITPEPSDDIPEKILKELMHSLGLYESDPCKILHEEILAPDYLKYYSVMFTRFSDVYVFGTLRECNKKLDPEFIKDQPMMIQLDLSFRKFKKEDSYGELYQYLEAFPEMRERLMTYFYMVEKPSVDYASSFRK